MRDSDASQRSVRLRVEDLLTLIPDAAAEVAYRRRLAREAYEEGWSRGWRAGYERGARLLEAQWPDVVRTVLAGGPTAAELELLRWGPGGRKRFGEPMPGDRFPRLAATA